MRVLSGTEKIKLEGNKTLSIDWDKLVNNFENAEISHNFFFSILDFLRVIALLICIASGFLIITDGNFFYSSRFTISQIIFILSVLSIYITKFLESQMKKPLRAINEKGIDFNIDEYLSYDAKKFIHELYNCEAGNELDVVNKYISTIREIYRTDKFENIVNDVPISDRPEFIRNLLVKTFEFAHNNREKHINLENLLNTVQNK